MGPTQSLVAVTAAVVAVLSVSGVLASTAGGANDHPELLLLAVITSAPKNFALRSAARSTYLSQLVTTAETATAAVADDDGELRTHAGEGVVIRDSEGVGVRVAYKFAIGNFSQLDPETRKKVEAEQAEFHDIAEVDAVEQYALLMRKTLAVTRWAKREYPFGGYHWLMKVDDDSFLNLPKFLAIFRLHSNKKYAYLGFQHNNSYVYHSPNAKYYEPNWWDCQTFLPYMSGCGYALTYDVVSYLAQPAVPLREFKNEDAGIGILLAPLDLTRIHIPDIRPEREGDIPLLCTHVLQHRLTVDEFMSCQKFIDQGTQKEDL
ncbi:beta-1,3-galactosyltransferase 6 [Pelomyxa schiedti]|nr:beta-1,3-galactosyltransferase 6 [Pelomyxa schiedti]